MTFSVWIFLFQNTSSVTVPETLLFVSTLDGSLHAVSKRTGAIKWTLKEGEQMSCCFLLRNNNWLFRLCRAW